MENTVKVKKTKFKGKNRSPFVWILCIILVAYTISLIFPLTWGLLASIKSPDQFIDKNLSLLALPDFSYWQGESIFSNYVYAFENLKIQKSVTYFIGDVSLGKQKTVHAFSYTQWDWATRDNFRNPNVHVNVIDMFVNTLLYAGGIAVIATFTHLLVGYLCARFSFFKFSGILYAFVIFQMSTPIVGTGATLINFLQRIGFFSEMWGEYIRQAGWTGINFLLFYAYYQGLSNTYSEAAEIDGASQLRILFSIAIPLAKTTISTILLLTFVSYWSDYNTPLLYLPAQPTIASGIMYFFSVATGKGDNAAIYNKIAIVMIMVVPILIIYIVFKDKLMGNLTLGGLKE